MDSRSERTEQGPSPKRIKVDSPSGQTDSDAFHLYSSDGCASPGHRIAAVSGGLLDSDSGLEVSSSTFHSFPSYMTINEQDNLLDINESFSSLSDTATILNGADQLDTSQDSVLDDDDNASTVSHLSDISGLSDLSGQDWKPKTGCMIWIQKQMQKGIDPRMLLVELGVKMDKIPQFVSDATLWKVIINMMAEPPRRHKLRHVNTLDDVVRLLRGAKNVIVLTGAGVSVSCGIPDFRSRDGIYSRLAMDFPDLPDPQAMFDIRYFSQDPRPFFKFARDIYPGKFQPSPCHRFIRLLEKQSRLLRNYTQNIDTLEKVADIKNVIECHGSFATATCTKCGHRVNAEEIRDIVLGQNIPICRICKPEMNGWISMDHLANKEPDELRELVATGVMKPDIVFFGEGLPDTFHEAMTQDKNKCDLLLVIGSSLKVRPVALIPSSLPPNVPQILINREPLPQCHFDVELLGDCDAIINHLCHMLGASWEEGAFEPQTLSESLHLLPWVNSQDQAGSSVIASSSINNVIEESIDCAGSLKHRHLSVDSARDSGIGENSNFTDDKFESINSEGDGEETGPSGGDRAMEETEIVSRLETSPQSLRGYWQPKEKRSLAERLPADSFYLIPPSRYIFPGAEVFLDPDEKYNYFDEEDDDSESTDSEQSDSPDNDNSF